MTAAAISSIDLPNLYISGLVVSRASNTTLSISAGICRDSTNSVDMGVGVDNPNANGQYVAAPITLNAAINGANGLDTGSFAASKVYSVFLITDSRGYEQTAAIMTLASNSAPLIPSGYDVYRLIGYAISDSSTHFLAGYTAGSYNDRIFFYDAPQATAITAGNATSYTAVNLIALVPNVNNLLVYVNSAFTPGAAGRAFNMQPGNATGDAVTILGQVTSVVLDNQNVVLAQPTTISSVSSPTINYKVANSGDAVAIKVGGFRFSV